MILFINIILVNMTLINLRLIHELRSRHIHDAIILNQLTNFQNNVLFDYKLIDVLIKEFAIEFSDCRNKDEYFRNMSIFQMTLI